MEEMVTGSVELLPICRPSIFDSNEQKFFSSYQLGQPLLGLLILCVNALLYGLLSLCLYFRVDLAPERLEDLEESIISGWKMQLTVKRSVDSHRLRNPKVKPSVACRLWMFGAPKIM